jgi:hypothetical protein
MQLIAAIAVLQDFDLAVIICYSAAVLSGWLGCGWHLFAWFLCSRYRGASKNQKNHK